jgi:hypothetical protein
MANRRAAKELTAEERAAICSSVGVSEREFLAQRGKRLRLSGVSAFGTPFDLGEGGGMESGRQLPQMREK